MELFESNEARKEAGHALSRLLSSYKDTPVLLMLSGGSALSLLEYVDIDILDQRVTVTTLDERFSTNPSINTFAQIKATPFFSYSIERNVHLIDTTVQEGDDLESMSSRFETALREWCEKHPAGVVITTMGIGTDGHTAGIFNEGHNKDFHSPSWVIGYSLPETITPYTERITVTFTFLKTQVDHAILFASGGDKQQLVHALLAQTLPEKMPMAIFSEMKDVSIYLEI